MNLTQALRELDLRLGATEEQIRTAYRTLVTKWHPDKHQNDPIRLREAELRIKNINKAFEVLQKAGFKTEKPSANAKQKTEQKTAGTRKPKSRKTQPPPPQDDQPVGGTSQPKKKPSWRKHYFRQSIVGAALFHLGLAIGLVAQCPAEKANELGRPPTKIQPKSIVPDLPETLTNSIELKLALIPAGTFTMGDGDQAHEVTLTQPFYLGVSEVTNAEWEKVMGLGKAPNELKDPDRPVEQVSWKDANLFCEKLSAMPEELDAGRKYRLPTEAEWEYACRAGTTTAYSFGDDESLLGDFAWFKGNAEKQTHPVGQKRPNSWDLFDMQGNVYEWCNDWYDDYPNAAVVWDPRGGKNARLGARVVRGGSFLYDAQRSKSAYRFKLLPTSRYPDVGFRLALSPSGAKPLEAGK